MGPKLLRIDPDAERVLLELIERERLAAEKLESLSNGRPDLERLFYQARNDLAILRRLPDTLGIFRQPRLGLAAAPAPEGEEREYLVHVFGVASRQVKVTARGHQEAIERAAKQAWPIFYQVFETDHGSFGEEVSHYLVDEVGDTEHQRSAFYDADGSPYLSEPCTGASDCDSCGGRGWHLQFNESYGWQIERCDACEAFNEGGDAAALFHVCRLARAYLAQRGYTTESLKIPDTPEKVLAAVAANAPAERRIGAVARLIQIAEAYIELGEDAILGGKADDPAWPGLGDAVAGAKALLAEIRGEPPPPAPPATPAEFRLEQMTDGHWHFVGHVPMALARKSWPDRYGAVRAAQAEHYDCFADGSVRPQS